MIVEPSAILLPPETSLIKANGHQPFAVAAGDYRVFALRAGHELSDIIWRQYLIRAIDFIDQYEVDTDPGWLACQIVWTIRGRHNEMVLLAAVDIDNQIQAHLIAHRLGDTQRGKEAIVLQVQNDTQSTEIIDVGWIMIEEWAKAQGVKRLKCGALSRGIARLNERKGFKDYRIEQYKDL